MVKKSYFAFFIDIGTFPSSDVEVPVLTRNENKNGKAYYTMIKKSLIRALSESSIHTKKFCFSTEEVIELFGEESIEKVFSKYFIGLIREPAYVIELETSTYLTKSADGRLNLMTTNIEEATKFSKQEAEEYVNGLIKEYKGDEK